MHVDTMFFKQHVYNYLDGSLMPVLSPSCITSDWLNTIWSDKSWKKDVIYISGNPFINRRTLRTVAKVHEAWRYGWSDKYMTTDPAALSEAFPLKLPFTIKNSPLVCN